MSVLRSVVKWFDAKKGYGFVVHPRGGNDIFVHYSQIETENDFKTLQTGEVVEFELHDGTKGPYAEKVNVIDTEADNSEHESASSSRADEQTAEGFDQEAERDGVKTDPPLSTSVDGASISADSPEVAAAEMARQDGRDAASAP